MAFTPEQRAAFKIVARLVPAAKEDRKVLARELGLLKKLRRQYAPLDFWETVRPVIQLDTLLYFLGPYGAQQLREEWGAYRIGQAEKVRLAEEALDREIALLERSVEAEAPIELDSPTKVDRIGSIKSAIQWADSPTP